MKKNYTNIVSFLYILMLLPVTNAMTIASAQAAQSANYSPQKSKQQDNTSIEAIIIQQELYGEKAYHTDDVTIGKDIFGNTFIEDNKGHKKTIGKDIFGNTFIEDNKGNKKTIGKDIFGNTFIEDSKGNKTTVKKDIFGNIVIEKR